MKYGNTFFLELPRDIFDSAYSDMSMGAKWLFVCLKELEHRFCNKDKDYFFRTDEQLAKDMGCSDKTLKKYKSELKKYPELVEIGLGHWENSETGKKSNNQNTKYRIVAGNPNRSNPKIQREKTETEQAPQEDDSTKIPPTLEMVQAYCDEHSIWSGKAFFNHFEARGWRDGKNKIRNWVAALEEYDSTHDRNGSWLKSNNGFRSAKEFVNGDGWEAFKNDNEGQENNKAQDDGFTEEEIDKLPPKEYEMWHHNRERREKGAPGAMSEKEFKAYILRNRNGKKKKGGVDAHTFV